MNNIPDPIKRIIEQLRTQDNMMTQHICFVVQKRRLISGFERQYFDHDEIMWMYDGEAIRRDHWEKLTIAERDGIETITIDSEEYFIPDLESCGFKEEWETVQSFFTRKGAEDYIAVNGHNLRRDGEPRIYGESFHRNAEMIAVREWLMGLAELAKRGSAVNTQDIAELAAALLIAEIERIDRLPCQATEGSAG